MKETTFSFVQFLNLTEWWNPQSFNKLGSGNERVRSGMPDSFVRQLISPVMEPERGFPSFVRIAERVSVKSRSVAGKKYGQEVPKKK